MDLVQDWLVENAREAILGGGGSGSELSISGIASYQPFDGLMDLKMVCSNYCKVTSFSSNWLQSHQLLF